MIINMYTITSDWNKRVLLTRALLYAPFRSLLRNNNNNNNNNKRNLRNTHNTASVINTIHYE